MDYEFIVLIPMSVPALTISLALMILSLVLLGAAVVNLLTRLQAAEERIDALLDAKARTDRGVRPVDNLPAMTGFITPG